MNLITFLLILLADRASCNFDLVCHLLYYQSRLPAIIISMLLLSMVCEMVCQMIMAPPMGLTFQAATPSNRIGNGRSSPFKRRN